MVAAGKRRYRVALGKTGKSPAANGGANEMQGPLARLLEKLTKEKAVESAQREPLGAPRGSRDDVDILGAQAMLPDEAEGGGAGA